MLFYAFARQFRNSDTKNDTSSEITLATHLVVPAAFYQELRQRGAMLSGGSSRHSGPVPITPRECGDRWVAIIGRCCEHAMCHVPSKNGCLGLT